MNPREKKLVFVVGALLFMFAARAVWNGYSSALNELDDDIEDKQDEIAEIQLDQKRLKRGKVAWSEAGRQTLGTDESEALTLFRPDLDALVQEVGLTNSIVQLKGSNKHGKNDLRAIKCTVTADGSLDQILRFLFKLHQRPYTVRCEDLEIREHTGKDIPPNTLRMIADLDSLLLPNAKEYSLPRAQPVDLSSQPAETIVRSKYDDFDEYREIVKRKIFEAWTPPIPPPGKVVGHNPPNNGRLAINAPAQLRWAPAAHAKSYVVYFGEQSVPPEVATINQPNFAAPGKLAEGKEYFWRVDSVNSEGRTEGDVVKFTAFKPTTPEPPVRPPPPPADANLTLARVVSSPLTQQAVLKDATGVNETRVEVGSPFFGGTLVFIHQKGAVSRKDDQLRFHAFDKKLSECVPLTEETQPEVLYELMKLQQRAEAGGISQRPG